MSVYRTRTTRPPITRRRRWFFSLPEPAAVDLTGLGIAQGQSTQSVVLEPDATLAGLNVAQAQAAQQVPLGTSLQGLGVAQGQATAGPTLAVTYLLAGLGIAQAQSAQNVILGSGGATLAALGVAQAQGMTQLVLVAVVPVGERVGSGYLVEYMFDGYILTPVASGDLGGREGGGYL